MKLNEKKKLVYDSIEKNYICPLPAFALYSNYGFDDMNISLKVDEELFNTLDKADAKKAELDLTEKEFTRVLDALVDDGRLIKQGDNYAIPDAESFYPNQVGIDETSSVPLIYFANSYWHILEVDFNTLTMTLMSKYPVAYMPYHEKQEEISWVESSLRHWLNNDYLTSRFTEEQQNMIIKKRFIDEQFSDKIWILSPDEMEWVLDVEGDSMVLDIPIWLRNNRGSGTRAPIGIIDGQINRYGIDISEGLLGVVPTIDVRIAPDEISIIKEFILKAIHDKYGYLNMDK